MRNKIICMVAVIMIFMTGVLISKPYCEISSIYVNSKLIDSSDYDDIVIRTNDTIRFNYELKGEDIKSNESFYYRVVLRNNNDSSFRVTGVASAPYVHLSENEYEFTIGAFDLRGSWLADHQTIRFRVNNRESYLREELDRHKTKLAQVQDLLADYNESKINAFDIIDMVIGIIIGVIIALFIMLLLKAVFKNKDNHKGRKMKELDDTVVPRKEYNKVLIENSNIRAEIASLRGQIDAMQSRASDMKKQNKELQESLNQLTSSKDELEKLQVQKDELFALIIHDIKNPAALIKSLVDLLRSYDLSAVEQQEIINDIAETTSRIMNLSHEVSKILALETSKLVLDIQAAQVSEIVEEVIRRSNIPATAKNISITSDISSNLPEAEIDVQKIDEVIDNLLSNAIKFTQSGGKIHVRTFVENRKINVEISDNGLGLSENDVRNAFQRGSRLSAQPTNGESSTGLGLWIVKKLVDAHNGRVWVKSTLGKGSTFAFSLPVKHNDGSEE